MFRRFLLAGYRLIILQLILLSIVAGVIVFTNKDWLAFASALLGGSAWIIPSWYFVRKIFKPTAKRDWQTLLKDFFWGEGVKILLSGGLIVLFKLLFPIKTGAFLSGYIIVIAASFLMPFWATPRNVAKKE